MINKMDGNQVPKKIKCKEQVFSLDFHPSGPYLAAGLVDGAVELWKYSNEEKNVCAREFHHHIQSCRGLLFTDGGRGLITISADKSWRVIDEQGTIITEAIDAHSAALNRLCLIDANTLATGDDDGVIKLWDMRTPEQCKISWDVHTDYVADMFFQEDSAQMFSCSGDTTLGVYDIRHQKNFYKSDDQESELNCLQLMRNGKKVLCGSEDGIMVIFNFNAWGDCSDRYPGHPESIECFHKIDETTLLTGSSDGIVRVVGVYPNKILGVVADLNSRPVEAIKADCNGDFIATISNDERIRFWDTSILKDDSDNEAGEEQGEDSENEGSIDENNEEEEEDDDRVEDDIREEDDGLEDDEEEGEEELDEEDDRSDSESSATGSDGDEEESDSDDKEENVHAGAEKGDGDSSSDESDVGHKNKKRKIPTAAEKFYADL